LEGTLAYIAPEQTGRINRTMDYRADFYSLGITFYEMLAGQLPFTAEDPMALVHAHIARSPPELPEEITPELALLVSKLLEKNPEDRYKSGYGILHDLQTLQQAFEADKALLEWRPGEHDITTVLSPPEKVYGRESELEILQTVLQEAVQGRFKFLIVDGAPGVGKSALIQELRKPTLSCNGRFTIGKFEQFNRNQPWYALLQVFRNLLIHLYSEPEVTRQYWKERATELVGEDIPLLLNMLPEFADILGIEPKSEEEVDSGSVSYRLNRTFTQLIISFAELDHPLVLFLDDLQWADASTLNFIVQLNQHDTAAHILMIGAYRDNEVGPDHPLQRCWNKLSEAGITPTTLSLTPLPDNAVTQLLADALSMPRKRVTDLAVLCQHKTGNNPLFLKLFLQILYEQALLEPDPANNCWQWDLEQIRQQQVTDNLVDLALARFDKLPNKTKSLLQVAALLGNQPAESTLAIAADVPEVDIRQHLMPAIQADLVLLIEGETRLFKFAHDRIQQTVYQSISSLDTDHVRIGRRLFNAFDTEQRNSMLLKLVGHLNHGWQALDDAQHHELLELNLQASRQAKEAGAFETAYEFSSQTLANLPEEYWQSHYQLCIDIHLNALEAALTTTDDERVEKLSQAITSHARNRLDKSRPYSSASSVAAMVKGDNIGALKLFRESTVILGRPIPIKANLSLVIRETAKTRLALLGKSPESLVDLPAMQDPELQTLMKSLNMICTPAAFVSSLLLSVLVMHGVRFSVRYGNTTDSIFFYTTYGMILSSIMGDIDKGYAFAQLGRKLVDKFDERRGAISSDFMYYSFVAHWKDGLHHTVEAYPEVYRRSMQQGAVTYAAGICVYHMVHSLAIGQPLNQVERESAAYIQILKKTKQARSAIQAQGLYQFIQDLMIGPGPDGFLEGEYAQAEQELKANSAANEKVMPFWTLLYRATLGAIYNDWSTMAKDIRAAAPFAKYSVPGQTLLGLYEYYRALSLLVSAQIGEIKVDEALKKYR
ncbi:MAG: AAA family ATPase, partial [Pseudomonadota bacterium]